MSMSQEQVEEFIRDTNVLNCTLNQVGHPYYHIIPFVTDMLRIQFRAVGLLAEPEPDMNAVNACIEEALTMDRNFRIFLDKMIFLDGVFYPMLAWMRQTRFKLNFICHPHHRSQGLITRVCRDSRRCFRQALEVHPEVEANIYKLVMLDDGRKGRVLLFGTGVHGMTADFYRVVLAWDKLTALVEDYRLKNFTMS